MNSMQTKTSIIIWLRNINCFEVLSAFSSIKVYFQVVCEIAMLIAWALKTQKKNFELSKKT